jgi:hypothetical protein
MQMLFEMLKTEFSHGHTWHPLFKKRLITLVVIFALNALVGFLLFADSRIPSNMVLFAILVANMVFYIAYYLMNKVISLSVCLCLNGLLRVEIASGECTTVSTYGAFCIAIILWLIAFYCFLDEETNWSVSETVTKLKYKVDH